MKIVSAAYLIGMWVYGLCVRIASLFNEKAKLLCAGRSETWRKLKDYDSTGGCIWVHAASLGEFEQGRPLIEAIKEKHPDQKIVLTFYSPSGYEVRKNYNKADLVCYLPADGPQNAKRFIDSINPTAVYFVKYEFWHFFLKEVYRRKLPLYGISMIFRKQQPFFSTWGDWFREMLTFFTHIYVQDKTSGELLESINVKNYSVVGDTRFDRVRQIADNAREVETVKTFVEGAPQVIVAGSTWPPDEDIIFDYINRADANVKLVIAPHEIDKARVDSLCSKLKVPYVRFTETEGADLAGAKVFVVNTIGVLSSIYRYGTLTYVGGGFGVGIHNTLEPAIYGLPVIFGPNHKKFKEALDLIDCGGGFSIAGKEDFNNLISRFFSNSESLAKAGKSAGDYCQSMLGATKVIMEDTVK